MSDLLDKIISGIPENTEESEEHQENKDPMDYCSDFSKEYGKKA